MAVVPAASDNHALEARADPYPRLQGLVALSRRLSTAQLTSVTGAVVQVAPGILKVAGLSKFAAIGDHTIIRTKTETTLGEIVGVEPNTVTVVPMSATIKFDLATEVTLTRDALAIRPSPLWKGRVIDPLGRPIDDAGPLPQGDVAIDIERVAPAPLKRNRLGDGIRTGVRAVDLFTPLCAGQRVGVFAGSGVGKSTLLGMLSRGKGFDTTVIALVGERGREVRDFLEDTLADQRGNVVAVVATGDESAMVRRLAPLTAVSIAEYFRDRGERVLLIIDSVTRYAHALREIALAGGEPPVARGFPPSVFTALPRLLERAGPGEHGEGSITAIASVLVDGDDHNDPIADAVRGILDGHIVLERRIAVQGRFPALDPLASVSRLATQIRSVEEKATVQRFISLIAQYEDTRDLRAIGGYRAGADPTLDQAVVLVPQLYEALRQGLDDPADPDVFATVGARQPVVSKAPALPAP